MIDTPHWSDTSRAARRWRKTQRELLRFDPKRMKARRDLEGASSAEIVDDANRVPGEYFTCPACGSGPWHINWGAICGNCSGAA